MAGNYQSPKHPAVCARGTFHQPYSSDNRDPLDKHAGLYIEKAIKMKCENGRAARALWYGL